MSGEVWRSKQMYKTTYYTNQEVYRRALEKFRQRPSGAIVRTMGIYCYQLTPSSRSQLSLFENVEKQDWLTKAVDEINEFYGMFTVHMGRALDGKKVLKQKIPFGGTEYFELLLKRA